MKRRSQTGGRLGRIGIGAAVAAGAALLWAASAGAQETPQEMRERLRRAVQAGPAAAENADRPAASEALREMFGEELVDASRTARSVNDLAGKRVAIYFSASWCGPCRAFTPRLIEAYQAWQEADEAVEVVLVSLDRSAADMRQYMRQARMPWLAVPHGSEQADALRERFQVRGIPMLVVVDAEGRTLSTSGRGEVGQQGAAALDRWKAASP